MTREKTVYVHIGIGRSGTTSLQNALYGARDRLFECGYYYPATGLEGTAHHRLAPIYHNTSTENLQLIYEELINELNSIDFGNVIISSEYFSFLSPDMVRCFISELEEFFSLKVIFYARKQGALFQSSYLQRICYNRYNKKFEKFVTDHLTAFDYSLRLKPWLESGVDVNAVCRLYDVPSVRSNVVADFISVIGAPEVVVGSISLNERAKSSLNFRLAELARLIASSSANDDEYSKLISELFKVSECLPSNEPLSLFDEQTKAIVEGYHKNRNAEFANMFLPESHRDLLTVF